MTLTGRDPFDPTPGVYREYLFAIGPSAGQAPERGVLLVGNRTSAGSEPLDVVDQDNPIRDDADARARFGDRSELYAMYRQQVSQPQDQTIWACAATESAGANAAVKLVVSGVSDKATTWQLHCHSEYPTYSAEDGDNQQTTAEGLADALNGWDEGRLQVTAVAAIDGAGPDWKVDVIAAQKGPRGDQIIGADATHGIRIKVLSGTGNTQSLAKSTITAGGGDDDWSAAIANIATGNWFYHVLAKTASTTLTATDNGLGEYLAMLKAQLLPVNAKDQQAHFGLVCTQPQGASVTQSAQCNTVQARAIRQQGSDLTTAMLAAHFCSLLRQREIAYPAANCNEIVTSGIPIPFNVSDRHNAAEVKADLNAGISSMRVIGNNTPQLTRTVLTRSLSDSLLPDYRAREGHIFSVVTLFWAVAAQRWDSTKQPNAADDPIGNQPPPARTSIPRHIRSMLKLLIEDMAGNNPLGVYDGPLLRPDRVQEMIDSIQVNHNGRGGFPTKCTVQAVLHRISWEAEIGEGGPSY